MILLDEQESYENLAVAIVAQAVKDYVMAQENDDVQATHAIERFFFSEYFQMLVHVDPDVIMDRLTKQGKRPRIDMDDIFKRR